LKENYEELKSRLRTSLLLIFSSFFLHGDTDNCSYSFITVTGDVYMETNKETKKAKLRFLVRLLAVILATILGYWAVKVVPAILAN